ncbi:type I-G CRISPR-associated protein Cas7 [Sediminivirga luteola]|uniref:CRISPR-associated protein Csb1 n=1 Tax=Sediminivirga luteola TaxID=1774748 RepID=A0A8J2XM63_9MICO|nr:type I-U CRISPR-associated protein Cas7 [Sediminivirga luteola]GGA28494.1 hypothetical protein GCM10011333_34040 [Sediminivirga luteola]
MSSTLKDIVAAHVADPAVSGLIIETEYEPLGGRAATVAPPTYAKENRNDPPRHAVTQEAFRPEADENGWFHAIRLGEDGQPVLVPRVVLDGVASQSGRAECALWEQQHRLGLALPGVIVSGEKAAVDVDDPALREALNITVSTWDLSHRQNDAWLKFATEDGKTQVWQQEIGDVSAPGANLKTLITQASPENAGLLFRHFPNSAVYGFWLSSGVAQRHRLARAYSSEIVGYGAHPVIAGTTKLDPVGGASNESQVTVKDGTKLTVAEKRVGKTGRPSEAGFGQVPADAVVRAYVCELILQQSSVSLQALRSLRFETPEQSQAALTVLTLLAMAGRVLGNEDGFLRSGCALVAVDERWGWRRHGQRAPEALDAPTVDDLAEALQEALADARKTGLDFAAPIEVQFSAEERQLIKNRVVTESTKVNEDGD